MGKMFKDFNNFMKEKHAEKTIIYLCKHKRKTWDLPSTERLPYMVCSECRDRNHGFVYKQYRNHKRG